MTLTERDRKIAVVLIPLALVAVYWFMLLAPKRAEVSAVSETLSGEQERLSEAQAQASTLSAAKANFERDYATVVRLGKAVPASVDMPSLLVQLEQAAKGTGISFEKLTVGERAAVEAPAAAPAPEGGTPDGAAPSGEAPASAPGQAAATAQDATDTASTPPATADATADTPGAPAAGGAPAPGALESVPLTFSFEGSFFELADLFHRLKRFVYVAGDEVRVRGRLMTIDTVSYTTDPENFPSLTADVTATVFLSPQAEGTAAGATPAGPAPASAPSTSTASTDGGAAAPAPTPTATATP